MSRNSCAGTIIGADVAVQLARGGHPFEVDTPAPPRPRGTFRRYPCGKTVVASAKRADPAPVIKGDIS